MQSIRLNREYELLKKEPIDNVTAGPENESDLTKWHATIHGPTETPYEGGLFNVGIEIPSDYPFMPPKVYFKTPIYHPNITAKGAICLDILKNEWSPTLNLSKVLLSLCSLLSDPNPDDPLVPSIAQLYKKNRAEFNRQAREYTIKYAG